MSILDRVTSTRDHTHASFNLLVYGAPGTGKTWMARTAVEAGHRVLLLDADQGTMTLRDTDVDTLPIHRLEDVMAVYDELEAGKHGYDTVFIDNLSELQKLLVDRLKREHGKKFGRQSWGMVIDQTSMLCRQFRSLPLNLVVLAHSMEIDDEDRVRVRPALHGKKLPHEIGGLFDLVGYAHTARSRNGEVLYRVGFATVGDRHITKDRSGRLEDVEPNDFGLLYRKVFAPAPAAAEAEGPWRPKVAVLAEAVAVMPSVREAAPVAGPSAVDDVRVAEEAEPEADEVLPAAEVLPVVDAAACVEVEEVAAAPEELRVVTLRVVEEALAPVEAAPAPEPVESALASDDGPVEVEETAEMIRALAPPEVQPAVEGAHGTASWAAASRRFQAVLMGVCEGDRARADFVCDIIKKREGVTSSVELHAPRLLHWADRLDEAARRGNLQRYFEKQPGTGESTVLRLHQNIIQLHGALSQAGKQAQATRVIKEAAHGKALYELDQYVLSGILGELRKMNAS